MIAILYCVAEERQLRSLEKSVPLGCNLTVGAGAMGEGAQARCRAHAAIRRRRICRLYCAAGVHRRPPFLLAQAREVSGRIGAALQISAALCARGGGGYDLSGPCLSDLIVRFRGSERDGGWWTGSPPHIPHQRLVLQESSTCNFYMRFQRTALVQECGT